jgi:hypothetical protein
VNTLIQEEVENRSYSWAFLDIEENSDSTSHDTTKVSNCHGLQDILAINRLHAEWQKNYSHHRWKNGGCVALCCMQRGILLAYSFEAWLKTGSYMDSGMAVIQLGMLYSHQKKFTNATSSFFRRLSVCKNSCVFKLSYQSIHGSFSTCINILCVGTDHKSRNVFFLTEALPSLSTQHIPLSKALDSNFLQSQNYERL